MGGTPEDTSKESNGTQRDKHYLYHYKLRQHPQPNHSHVCLSTPLLISREDQQRLTPLLLALLSSSLHHGWLRHLSSLRQNQQGPTFPLLSLHLNLKLSKNSHSLAEVLLVCIADPSQNYTALRSPTTSLRRASRGLELVTEAGRGPEVVTNQVLGGAWWKQRADILDSGEAGTLDSKVTSVTSAPSREGSSVGFEHRGRSWSQKHRERR